MNLQIISPKLSEINKEQPQKNGTLEKPKPSETCPKKGGFLSVFHLWVIRRFGGRNCGLFVFRPSKSLHEGQALIGQS